jgi:hypothetical protein
VSNSKNSDEKGQWLDNFYDGVKGRGKKDHKSPLFFCYIILLVHFFLAGCGEVEGSPYDDFVIVDSIKICIECFRMREY